MSGLFHERVCLFIIGNLVPDGYIPRTEIEKLMNIVMDRIGI